MSGGSKRRAVESVHGLVLLNKPAGITSNRALQRVKRLFGVRKAGHTGSLDPAATGMLPLCLGEATKISAFLLDSDKCYRVTARLGEARDTGDRDGQVVRTAQIPDLSRTEWEQILAQFQGETEQIPPMYSALKRDGRRLYELARQGETVEREPRRIRIDGIALSEVAGPRVVFRVRCSKGTYIRSLVEDIARLAGTIAYTEHLHREWVDPFAERAMVGLAALERQAADAPDGLGAHLLAPDIALADRAELALGKAEADRFMHGQRLRVVAAASDLLRVYGPERHFLGIAECDAEGRLSPRRVFHL